MLGIINEILAVVAPAVDITLVATTGLLIAVKINRMDTKSSNTTFTCTSKFRSQKQLFSNGDLKAKFSILSCAYINHYMQSIHAIIH